MRRFRLPDVRGAAAALLLPLLLVGCASAPLQHQQLLDAPPAQASGKVELTDVAFFPQEDYHCGPAALATVMNWAGEEVHPDDLTPRVYLDGRRGSLQAEMLAATRRQGLLPYLHEPRFSTIIEQLDAGQPVLVLQNLALDRFPTWHYAVVVGYDLAEQTVILRSGTTEREVMSFRRFERTWQRGDYWAITVHEPHALPARASEHRYLAAAAALEQVGELDAAGRAFHTASVAWPESLGAWVGRGNISYYTEDYASAVAYYRRALEHHPDSAAAHHNLAWALIRMGRTYDAWPHATRAYQLSAEAGDHYRSALQQLRTL